MSFLEFIKVDIMLNLNDFKKVLEVTNFDIIYSDFNFSVIIFVKIFQKTDQIRLYYSECILNDIIQ